MSDYMRQLAEYTRGRGHIEVCIAIWMVGGANFYFVDQRRHDYCC